MLLTFVGRLGNDPALTGWIGDLKRDLLARPELGGLIRNIWHNAQPFIARSASGESQVLGHHLTGMFVKTGELLATDHELRGEVNEGMVTVLGRFIAEQKSGVSGFISSQVKSWNM